MLSRLKLIAYLKEVERATFGLTMLFLRNYSATLPQVRIYVNQLVELGPSILSAPNLRQGEQLLFATFVQRC